MKGTLVLAVKISGFRFLHNEKTGLNPDFLPIFEVLGYHLENEVLCSFSEKSYLNFEDNLKDAEDFHNSVSTAGSKEQAVLSIEDQKRILQKNRISIGQELANYKALQKGVVYNPHGSTSSAPSNAPLDTSPNTPGDDEKEEGFVSPPSEDI
jgi:hypothetical protein